MREVKFRGKRADNGEWIYGDLVQWKRLNLFAILPQDGSQWDTPSEYKVIPETVGQIIPYPYSKNTDLYHGDILKCLVLDRKHQAQTWYIDCVIEWEDFNAVISLGDRTENISYVNFLDMDLTGNIYDK